MMQLLDIVEMTILDWLEARKCLFPFWLPYVMATTPGLFGDWLTVFSFLQDL